MGDQKPTYSDAKQKPLPNNPAFNKLKTLVGGWVLEDEKGNPAGEVVLAYRLVSAGSVIQESIFPGQPREMVTMWHMDGNKMVGTHYCALGMQLYWSSIHLGFRKH